MNYHKALIVSNMYPSGQYPSYGVFVMNFCKQLGGIGVNYNVCALTKTRSRAWKILKYALFYVKTFLMSLFGGYDLVYVHYPSYSAAPVILAKKFRAFDIISNVHGSDVIPLKAEHEKMARHTEKALNLSRKIVVPSEYFKRTVIEKYAVEPDKVFVYPSGGVSEAVFYEYDKARKMALREEYGISNDAFVIGYVSRITKAKGWDVFLDALEKCAWPEGRDVKICIVGNGEDDKLLADKIHGLPQRVRNMIIRYPLLPQRKLADIYNLLDAFAFPTVASESLGLVAIEAMACGAPVIASDYAAPAYYVKDGINGRKFIVGNSEDLKEKIEEFLAYSSADLENLKKGALSTAREYSSEAVSRSLERVFEK